jgi:DNA-binding NarL/FixJ family response regulator
MHFHARSGKIATSIKPVIVIADAVPSTRHAVAHVLTRAFDRRIQCESAGSYIDCAALVAARDVALVLLDAGLLKSRGLSAIGRLRDGGKTPAILLVAGTCDPETMRIVMMQGAAGYLPKTASHAMLIGAVRAVLEGERFEGVGPLADIAVRSAVIERHAQA